MCAGRVGRRGKKRRRLLKILLPSIKTKAGDVVVSQREAQIGCVPAGIWEVSRQRL